MGYIHDFAVLNFISGSMASLSDLPLELLLEIGFLLDIWDDIYSFTAVFRTLRKFMHYAKYARKIFERTRSESPKRKRGGYYQHDSSRKIVNVGDDRVRYYRNPWYDDRTLELWKVHYAWIDYGAKFWKGEQTSLTWIFKPYGDNFDGKKYSPTASAHLKVYGAYNHEVKHISVIEICAAFRQDNSADCRVPMQNWLQEKVKRRFDNLFTRMIFAEMTHPKLKYEDYGDVGALISPERLCKRYIEFGPYGMCYQKKCYPWLNESDPEIQKNIRGKMKRKHCYGEVIDVRDFLDA